MGIPQLESFLHENKPNPYCRDVNIKDLVKEYKRNEGVSDAVMLVDGNCFQYEQYDLNSYDWLMGGQLQAWGEHVRMFIDKFKRIGVKLVFFFDGSIVRAKENLWIERQKKFLQRQDKVFKLLREGENPNNGHLKGNMYPVPSLVGACGRYFLKHDLNCEVYVSVGDCDIEVAKFARENRCFAIFSQDTDYLIHEGAKYYLSMRFFDLSRMRAIQYDREGLASFLSLKYSQLPLFATLLGNDIVKYNVLRRFSEKICKVRSPNISLRVNKIAEYVQKQPTGEELITDLKRISREVLGCEKKFQVLLCSIQSYTYDNERNTKEASWRMLAVARRKHVKGEIPPALYPIMLGKPYDLRMALEDFSENLPAAANIYLPLRQKIYGILLHDSPESITKVEEWCVSDKNLSKFPQYVSVTTVQEELFPGLEQLWSDSYKVSSIRWKLLASTISADLSESRLKLLPLRHLVPAATMHYLLHPDRGGPILKQTEVDAFISQAVLLSCNMYKPHELKYLSTNSLPTPRLVTVSTIISRGITTVQLLMAACGFKLDKVMPWIYFDGKLFHKQYLAAENGASDLQLVNNQKYLLQDFRAILQVAYMMKPEDKENL